MKHRLAIEFEVETYSEAGQDRAGAVVIAAMRSAHSYFSTNSITDSGTLTTTDGVRITWTATQQETHQ